MEDGETISSMQMRFTHIVNKLKNLGKTISNLDCTNKILWCMTKEWQPKVTAIKELQNRNVLSMITLFEKLKLLDICMLASLLSKTNIQMRCWTGCSNILAWFSVPCTLPCFTHAFIYLRNPHLISCWSSCVFLRQNHIVC